MKILKWLKKQRLLKKYKRNDKDLLNHIHLIKLLGSSHEAVKLSMHYMQCESRCYDRIKKL